MCNYCLSQRLLVPWLLAFFSFSGLSYFSFSVQAALPVFFFFSWVQTALPVLSVWHRLVWPVWSGTVLSACLRLSGPLHGRVAANRPPAAGARCCFASSAGESIYTSYALLPCAYGVRSTEYTHTESGAARGGCRPRLPLFAEQRRAGQCRAEQSRVSQLRVSQLRASQRRASQQSQGNQPLLRAAELCPPVRASLHARPCCEHCSVHAPTQRPDRQTRDRQPDRQGTARQKGQTDRQGAATPPARPAYRPILTNGGGRTGESKGLD